MTSINPRRRSHTSDSLFETPMASHGKGPAPFYEATGVRLYKGDCREVLNGLVPESVDLIFADPPYQLSAGGITCVSGRMAPVDKGEWDKPTSPKQQLAFAHEWLQACRRVMRPNATIWVSGTSHVIFAVGYAMQELGFRILNDIIWFKPNAPPNLGCRCFTHSTELIIWASKSRKSKHVFNYADMKREAGGKQMRNLWSITAPGKQEKTHGRHPTQKPLALLARIIKAASSPNDLVLDPFSGSGTTGLAALQLERRYVGIEMREDYLDLSIRRMTHQKECPSPPGS